MNSISGCRSNQEIASLEINPLFQDILTPASVRHLLNRYSERKKSAAELSERVN
jgi:hypothetical protein